MTLKVAYAAYLAACERAVAHGTDATADAAWLDADVAYAAYLASDTTRTRGMAVAHGTKAIAKARGL